jgi:hypothetical protein
MVVVGQDPRTRLLAAALPLTLLAVALAAAPHSAADTIASVPGSDGSQWTPFFDTGPLEGSGWSTCPEPIGVSIDTTRFYPDEVSRVDLALTKAVALWSRQPGLSFAYAGVVPMLSDPDTGVISPEDGKDRPRHLYVAFIPDAQSNVLTRRIVGLGEPTTVDVTNREIVTAEATFELDYVRKASVAELVPLFAHEMGHALGLGHSGSKADVMYPIVTPKKGLGQGDIAGLRIIQRPCTTSTPSRDYPLPE